MTIILQHFDRGLFLLVAFGYSRDSYSEISRLGRQDENRRRIIPLTVERLIAADFAEELEMWMGG